MAEDNEHDYKSPRAVSAHHGAAGLLSEELGSPALMQGDVAKQLLDIRNHVMALQAERTHYRRDLAIVAELERLLDDATFNLPTEGEAPFGITFKLMGDPVQRARQIVNAILAMHKSGQLKNGGE